MKRWARSRVALAIMGAILAGGIAATWILLPSLHLGLLSSAPAGSTNLQTTQAHPTAPPSAGSGPTTPSSGGGSSQATPTPRSRPTAPTATPSSQGGQPVDLHGHIVQVNTAGSYFTFQELSGSLDTIYVNGNSRFTGSAGSLATLTPGRAAEVTGVRQSATTCLASLINEASNND
jgi:hypothetical protein